MATKEFILQGFTSRTHANAVRELFDVPDVQRVILSIAFVNESGVEQIEAKLAANAKRLLVFAGIRNDITSHQGLLRLYGIGGKLYAVDTGARNVIFHPKLYLVRGADRARLVIGSANLTLGGLNNNIEAGMMLDFDLANAADKAVVDGIETQFAALPNGYPDNLHHITTTSQLDEMLADGRLLDEKVAPTPRPKTSAHGTGATDTVPRIKLKVARLHRVLVKAKPPQKKTKVPKQSPVPARAPIPKPVPAAVGVEFELVWESKPLAERDLNIPSGANTHATGSINLDKGLLPDDVDQRHYFRDDVFTNLNWVPKGNSGKVEEAFARFQLILKGISYGEFDLRIGHSTDTTSKTYIQNNAMTRLSWGSVRSYIANPALIGRTLALYRDQVDPTRFILEID